MKMAIYGNWLLDMEAIASYCVCFFSTVVNSLFETDREENGSFHVRMGNEFPIDNALWMSDFIAFQLGLSVPSSVALALTSHGWNWIYGGELMLSD